MVVQVQPPELPKDANGFPIPVLGNYGPNEDPAQPDETFTDTVAEGGSYELTHSSNHGPLQAGAMYRLCAVPDGVGQNQISDNDVMYYRFAAAGATAPTVDNATDNFWPIGRNPVFTFKCMPGQEQMSLYFNLPGGAPASTEISLVRLR